jgi:hypothetical protein
LVRWQNRMENALQDIRPSVSSLPVGNLACARWAEIVDIILSCWIDMFDYSDAFACGGWFDGRGIAAVLRAKAESVDLLNRPVFQTLLRLDMSRDDVSSCVRDQLPEIERRILESIDSYLQQCTAAPQSAQAFGEAPPPPPGIVTDDIIQSLVAALQEASLSAAPLVSDESATHVEPALPVADMELDWEGNPYED